MKLISKINKFFDLFLLLNKTAGEGEAHVAQCKGDFLNSTEELFEFLDLLSYLKSTSASPTLKAQKALLSLKSKILNDAMPTKPDQSLAENPEFRKEPKETVFKKQNNQSGKAVRSLIVEFIEKNQGHTPKAIFNFLKGKISKRTFQRHLAELSKSGDIVKKLENGSPKYYISH
ncbi:MAG: hypothetical protein HYX21_04270 [Candidatus Yanofskybacteria bacterium]|nr:hypothetical protein [Candidatus Yanofskybacteria bacterium]